MITNRGGREIGKEKLIEKNLGMEMERTRRNRCLLYYMIELSSLH